MKATGLNKSILTVLFMGIISFGFGTESNSILENRSEVNDELKPIAAGHKSVSGELSGFDCAVVGVLCPTTHRGADYTTGVFTEDEKFYFVVNIPQSFLQQYFRKTVEVEGTLYEPYEHAVEPEIIHIIEGDERRLVYEEGYFIDENNRRATFQDGVFRDGRWVVTDAR